MTKPHPFEGHRAKHVDGQTICAVCGKFRYDDVHDGWPEVYLLRAEVETWKASAVRRLAEQTGYWIDCCDHCGCRPDDRDGHDDTCAMGCND